MFIDEQRHQVVHCPQMFDAATIADVRAHLDDVEMRQQVAGERDEKANRPGAGTDSVRLDAKWYDLWRTVPDDVVHMLRPYTWVVYPVQIRHISRPEHLEPWHQDGACLPLMGQPAHRKVITCFVPLEHDAERTATLQFAIGERPLLQHVPLGAHGACISDASFVDMVTFRPAFGDALVFGDHAPHRAVVPHGCRIDRRSFEFSIIDPRDAIAGTDYFDLDRRSFVSIDAAEREVA